MQIFFTFLPKNLHISKKSSNFAPAFESRERFSRKTINFDRLKKAVFFQIEHPLVGSPKAQYEVLGRGGNAMRLRSQRDRTSQSHFRRRCYRLVA